MQPQALRKITRAIGLLAQGQKCDRTPLYKQMEYILEENAYFLYRPEGMCTTYMLKAKE